MTGRLRIFRERSRGRSRGHSNLYESALESIVLLSRKYDLNPNSLVDTFVEAWTNKTCSYGNLEVDCREVSNDRANFLVTKEERVISQFPIKIEILKNPEFLKSQIQNIPKSVYLVGKISKGQKKKMNELRIGMKGINVEAKVINVPPKQNVFTRLGFSAYVSNISVADETGTVKLSLWNDQIEQVHVGDEVEVENCYVASYAGELQLRIRRKGRISIIDNSALKSVL